MISLYQKTLNFLTVKLLFLKSDILCLNCLHLDILLYRKQNTATLMFEVRRPKKKFHISLTVRRMKTIVMVNK